jgi:hypothetical protein
MWQRQEREGAVAVEASVHNCNIIIAPIGDEKKTWQEEGIECPEGEMKREGEEEKIVCPKSRHQHDVIVHIHSGAERRGNKVGRGRQRGKGRWRRLYNRRVAFSTM